MSIAGIDRRSLLAGILDAATKPAGAEAPASTRWGVFETGVSIDYMPYDSWRVRIGNELTGYTGEHWASSWEEAEAWLLQNAAEGF